jgi:predicted acyltransferase
MTPPALPLDASRISTTLAPHARQRLLSLDVLRGITVALMILVNNAGDGSVSYPQLRHSRWNGCTLTDFVFPTFLFMVGASIELSFQTRLARGVSALTIYLQVIRRALVLFALGVLLNALPFFHLAELRFYGVLQRIALCYLLAAAVYLTGGLRSSLLICVASILGYWWLMTHVAMPEFGLPGRDVPLLDPTGNLASLTDRMLVSQSHLYHHDVYDPEGLLSTLPALGTTLLGVCSAAWLRSRRTPALRAVALLLAGVLCMLAGLAWSHTFPFNKRLWTSSFVLWTGGLAMVLLAILFWLLDGHLQLRRGLTPWLALGTNALAAYILSELLAIVLSAVPVNASHGQEDLQQWLFRLLPHWLGPPPLLSFVYSLLFVLVCALPMLVLYRRRIFLKL